MLPRSGAAADRLDLSGLWTIFRRRIRVFLYTAIIIFDIAVLFAVYLPRQYTATAVVVLNADDAPVAPTSTKDPSDAPTSNSDVETEMAIITSRDISSKVVDYLHLEDDQDLRARIFSGGWRGMIGLAQAPPAGPLDAATRAKLREAIIRWIAGQLDVNRVSSAYAFSVAFTDTNAIRGTSIANATSHIYTDEQIRTKARQNEQNARLLGARIDALREQAQTDFDAVQNYRIANNLLSTTGATLTEQEISAYNQQVAGARAEARRGSGQAQHGAPANPQRLAWRRCRRGFVLPRHPVAAGQARGAKREGQRDGRDAGAPQSRPDRRDAPACRCRLADPVRDRPDRLQPGCQDQGLAAARGLARRQSRHGARHARPEQSRDGRARRPAAQGRGLAGALRNLSQPLQGGDRGQRRRARHLPHGLRCAHSRCAEFAQGAAGAGARAGARPRRGTRRRGGHRARLHWPHLGRGCGAPARHSLSRRRAGAAHRRAARQGSGRDDALDAPARLIRRPFAASWSSSARWRVAARSSC